MKSSKNTGVRSTPYGLDRRSFLKLAGLGTGALVLGGCGLLTSENRRAGDARTTGGQRDYELEVAPAEFELGGRMISTWGYNGGVPGPEIRVRQGETLRARSPPA